VTLDGTVKERSPAEQYRLDVQLRWDAGADLTSRPSQPATLPVGEVQTRVDYAR
jgi:hypothetical protein